MWKGCNSVAAAICPGTKVFHIPLSLHSDLHLSPALDKALKLKPQASWAAAGHIAGAIARYCSACGKDATVLELSGLKQKSSLGHSGVLVQCPNPSPAVDKALKLKPKASRAAARTDGQFADDGWHWP